MSDISEHDSDSDIEDEAKYKKEEKLDDQTGRL